MIVFLDTNLVIYLIEQPPVWGVTSHDPDSGDSGCRRHSRREWGVSSIGTGNWNRQRYTPSFSGVTGPKSS